MASGRPVGDSTMAKRNDTFFSLVSKSDKVIDLAEAQINDAKVKREAMERQKRAKLNLYQSLKLTDEQVEAMLAADGLNADDSANEGRIDATARVVAALQALKKDFPTLKHILGSEAGKQIVNDSF